MTNQGSKVDAPLVAGGQGRSDDDVRYEVTGWAFAVAWVIIVGASLAAWAVLLSMF